MTSSRANSRDGGAQATVLTVFFVPALYAAWFRIGRAAAAPGPEPVPAVAA